MKALPLTRRVIVFTLWFLPFSIAGCVRIDSQSFSLTPQPTVSRQSDRSYQSTPSVAYSANSENFVWSQLQQPDIRYVVLVRHALAPGTGDPPNFQLEDCSTQRNLSAEGRAQAKHIGEAFKQRGILVQQVLSSQWCRCLETAELMDIGTVELFSPLNSFFSNRSTSTEQTAQVRQFILNHQDTLGVIVMVTHFVNISALSEVGVSSGEMVVMQVNDKNQLEVVDQISAF